jgi:hypothetical protein
MFLAIKRWNRKEAVKSRTQKETRMRALEHIQAGHHESEEHVSLFKSLLSRISELSEPIWLFITLLLFIIMGPFSVIAVLYGLWALATGEIKEKMVEPASC